MRKISFISFLILCFISLLGCANTHKKKYPSYTSGKSHQMLASSKNYHARGTASWYGKKFHKRKTSSGERYNMYQLTAAHRTLPLSSRVKVTNLMNGRYVVVRINDRGPFRSHRIIDVSYAAAKKLGMLNRGTVKVEIQGIG